MRVIKRGNKNERNIKRNSEIFLRKLERKTKTLHNTVLHENQEKQRLQTQITSRRNPFQWIFV